MNESHPPEKTAAPRAPGALPPPDAFQANETAHWPTMTKTYFYTDLTLTMIGGRFLAPQAVFEDVGLMVMGAGITLFVIGLWRGKIALDDPEPESGNEEENVPGGR